MPQVVAVHAKLSVPRLGAVVSRAWLLKRIGDAGPAVWISAPPGAGKTTLAASYAAATRQTTLWYRIDGGDADPATFFYFMALAAAQALPRRRIDLPLLTPEYLPDIAGFARRFFRTLFARLPPDSLLVVDNLHELDGLAAFDDILREALSALLPTIKLVFVSRSEAPPALARFVANRELHLLDWNDLRLTPDETRALAGNALDDQTIRRLHEQAGGWAAGVVLLLRCPDAGENASLHFASQQAVFNYFAGEILAKAPADVRDLLIRTAFFPDFTAAMAGCIGAGAGASELLNALCRQHCFVDRSGARETSYRYHDLFRDFLRTQAGPDTAAFRRAAAAALAESGRALEAIPLLLENGDWQAAAGLILGHAQALVDQGRWQTLAGWIDALPERLCDATPWLLYWRGVAELPTRPPLARAAIERAYAGFAAGNENTGRMLAVAAIMEANFHEYASFSALDQWFDVLESLGGIRAAFPTPAVEMRVLAGMLVAAGHRRPDNPLGQAVADRLEVLLAGEFDPNQKAVAAAFLLWYAIWIGDFAQARRVHAGADRLLNDQRMTPLNSIMLRCIKGHGENALGDGAGAQEVFAAAEHDARQQGFAFARASLVLPMQIYRHLNFGDLAAAERLLAEAATQPYSGAMNASQIEFSRSWLALLRGNAPLACEHARIAAELAECSGSFVARASTQSGWALCLAEMNDVPAAQRHLAAAREVMAGHRTGLLPFHLLLVEAWLALRAGDATHCRTQLRAAFAQGAAQGYANTLQWLPRMMSALCAEALHAGIETDYVRGLIARRGLAPPATDVEHWPWPLQIRTLGAFEVLKEGVPIEFPRKTPKRPIALLKALVALGGPNGQGVPEARLIDALWPDGDAAEDALAINLHRLRRLLGAADAIRVQGGRIVLNAETCWVDAWAMERLVDAAATAAAAGRVEECTRCAQQVHNLYRGNFLADDLDAPWAISPRERLRMRFVQHVAAATKIFCQRGACDHVIEACQRGLAADDLVETFYQELMRCYRCRGRHAEGLAVYRRMQRTFSAVLGIAPSAASEEMHRSLRNDTA